MQPAISAPERRQRAQSRCAVCKNIGHNKRNCPQVVNADHTLVQRVGSRPVGNNGNMRDLETRDLNTARSGYEDGSSIGSNMESEGSDAEAEANFDLPTVWEDVVVEDAPDQDPQRIQIPEFIPYPEPYIYGPTSDYTIITQEDDTDTLHVWQDLIFNNLFTPLMIDHFVTATNAYAHFHGATKWVDTDNVEMKAFIGVILYLGICKYPNRKMAWSPAEGSAKLRGMMTKKRFELILSYWHYTDFTTLSKPQLEEVKKNDPFWGVSDFCRHAADRFEAAWNPGQDLDIDENTCGWKGRHRSRCYNPKKPQKWHFKFYAKNCS